MEKAVALMGQQVEQMQDLHRRLQHPLPEPVAQLSPKISKGEKYEGLPWVMLDFPRLFGREDTWAIRTFFWWGHFFSITLHLRGSWKRQYESSIQKHWSLLKEHAFYICIADDEWQHHFGESNYLPLHQMTDHSINELLSGNDFCKLSAKISLEHWETANEKLVQLYQVLLQALGHD
ncbi:hypothetical protein [Paraflavitalea pollutisoli]|uniref:hypothetical protein n=1 Tax=Paraflavitalea pollutisoli TaxID=3034143 RepID=UPI0023ED42BE|nr:hypothetical protein [Paraflavitalea sp. H1-2-19X]